MTTNSEEAVYTFNILFVLSQASAKASVIIFIRTITPAVSHRHLAAFAMLATLIWIIVAFPGLVFQCHTPYTWKIIAHTCVNRVGLYTYIEVVSGLLDVFLVALPVFIAWKLQLRLKAKMIVIICFAFRIL